MTFSNHVARFEGKPVVDFESGMSLDPKRNCYGLRVDYGSDVSFADLFAEFVGADGSDEVTGLLTGAYSEEMYEEPMAFVVELIVAAAPRLPSLTGLFIGDIISEENEVSWIVQGDVSPVWTAFPRLRTLYTRGSNGLSFGDIVHEQLQTLVVQSGGLPKPVVGEVLAARLPELTQLELYLGTTEYGWDGEAENLRPLLESCPFPKLKYLGLRNSEIADELAKLICGSPILEQLETLDLSLGTLSDEGGQALLECPAVRKLKQLNLSHHYLSDGLVRELQGLPLKVDLSDPQQNDRGYRYTAIGE